jgi:dTDP-4-amino-4,6-dideoxygalactose transaminase
MPKRIFLSPPHMGGKEMEYIKQAFESNYIAPLGPMVDAFERVFAEKIGIPHAVALSSGTAAMHLALRNLGIGPGDEVFASTLTFIGSVSPVVFQGARPVFIDADADTWNMDLLLLEEELHRCYQSGRLPKAVVPTDLYGQCIDVKKVVDICHPYGVPVIIDAAESLGATQNSLHAGNGAHAAIYSFNGNKIITTSGGGMLASEDRDFIERARFLSQQARDPFPHYEHSQIGYNYRMSNIVAAIGVAQLECLEERVRRRREIYAYYQDQLADLPGIQLMPEAPHGRSNGWLTVILVDPEIFGADREAIRLSLEKENIESRPVWKPMHLQPVFIADVDYQMIQAGYVREGRYPARAVGGRVSEYLFDKGLCLPSGSALTETDLSRIIHTIRSLYKAKIRRSA